MKILFLTDGITPFVQGGMQRHSQLVIESLAKRGNEITVYHFVKPGLEVDYSKAFTKEALENISFECFEYQDLGWFPGHYLGAQKEISKRYFNKLRSTVKSFDFIYTKGFMGWALLKQKSQLGIEVPIGVKFHGMNMFQKQADFKSDLSKFLLRPTASWILKNSDFIFSYGGKITDIIHDQCGTSIVEVPTGIESDWLVDRPNVNNPIRRFVFVGRFDRVKGLPELYDALNLLIKLHSDWEFHFIGPIPSEHQIKMKQTVFHGPIYDKEKLQTLIASNDILVNCSISEGMPNVILEAMSQGLAIVATDVGATSVLVKNGLNGMLIEDSTPKRISDALYTALLKSDSELTYWKCESLKMANEMTWESIGPRLETAIQKCIRG